MVYWGFLDYVQIYGFWELGQLVLNKDFGFDCVSSTLCPCVLKCLYPYDAALDPRTKADKIHDGVFRILDGFKQGPTPQCGLDEFLMELTHMCEHSSIEEKFSQP